MLMLFTTLIWWYYRSSSTTHVQPKWTVVDFEVKTHRGSDDFYSIRKGLLPDADRPPGLAEEHQAYIVADNNEPSDKQQLLSYDELQDKIHDFIQWDRPSTDHWPSWHEYDQATYDPNRWEAMDRYEQNSSLAILY